MTDDLVQRLRDLAEEWFEMCGDFHEPFYEAADHIEAQAAEIERLRQHQSDALHDQLLQECLVKLRDVQGTQAPKQYACNLIKRVERVLQEQSK